METHLKFTKETIIQYIREGIQAYREKNGEEPLIFASSDIWWLLQYSDGQKFLEYRDHAVYFDDAQIIMFSPQDVSNGSIVFAKNEQTKIIWMKETKSAG